MTTWNIYILFKFHTFLAILTILSLEDHQLLAGYSWVPGTI